MDAKTFTECKNILDYVMKGSKFYQDKFAKAGFDPAEVKTQEDFTKIPFTTKGGAARRVSARSTGDRRRKYCAYPLLFGNDRQPGY